MAYIITAKCVCNSDYKKKTYNYKLSKERLIIYKFGLNYESLNELYKSQNGKCKICGKEYDLTFLSKHNGLYIDHCHNTGKVRGLLCANCNSVLGHGMDNIEILKSAIKYL